MTVSHPPRLRIAVTRALPEPVIAMFAARHDLWINPHDRPLTPDELQQAARDADALIITAFDRLDKAALGKFPDRMRIAATYSVGNDHIDLAAAHERGVAVLSTPDVLSNAVAETAILLMLAAARRAREGTELLYGGRWGGWTPTQLLGIEVTGRRLGILGMGRIGRAIACRGRGFEMDIHYHNRTRLAPEHEAGGIYHASVEGLLAQSDVLVLAAPSTPETKGVINAARLACLPPEAIVVNIARGDLIDDTALIAALRDGRVAAAGLDVFANEPNLDRTYLTLANVFLQPHQGSSTVAARVAMGRILLDGMDAVLAGARPFNQLA